MYIFNKLMSNNAADSRTTLSYTVLYRKLGSISTVLAIGRKRLFTKGVAAPGYVPEGTRRTCLHMAQESPRPVNGEEILN